MTKNRFEQQATQAQKEMANWSKEKIENVQLQGRYRVQDSVPNGAIQVVERENAKKSSK